MVVVEVVEQAAEPLVAVESVELAPADSKVVAGLVAAA